jgi:uroporphyrin-III C-methyltransferase / precorrin-2 dehydrogenase / sirohydrochlorin ferrochelatase
LSANHFHNTATNNAGLCFFAISSPEYWKNFLILRYIDNSRCRACARLVARRCRDVREILAIGEWKRTMKYFPIFLEVDQRRVVVVGGGETALQKVRLLLKTTAKITVVSDDPCGELAALAREGRVELNSHVFAPGNLRGAALVFVATADRNLTADFASAARELSIPVNVADDPKPSTFITPAIVDRDPVVVAIGTEGTSPVLAREIKTHLEAHLPSRFGSIARAAANLRERVAASIGDFMARRRFWERLLAGAFRQAALAGDTDTAERLAAEEIRLSGAPQERKGRVVLIGCGPGSGDLLTLQALRAMQAADVLVVDRLVPEEIVERARREAKRFYVGKTPGGPATEQSEINALLVREGLKGQVVARLKGGDAFVFGRAAEEMVAVRAAGLEVDIVPGITAAHACAARIGLPLTLRNKIREFSLVTGATADDNLDLNWEALAAEQHAFAVYMGVGSTPAIRKRLLAAGAPPDLPVVIVENGTLASERAFATVLRDLDGCMKDERIVGPAILFFGLDWAKAGLSRPAHVKEYQTRGEAETIDWTAPTDAQATHWVMG